MAPTEVAGELLALQRGDQDAFASLMARYKNRLYRYLLRWVQDPATAEDLFQQTWLRVLENISRFNPTRSFDAWLFTVARNLAIDQLRRRRPESLDEPAEEAPPLQDRLAMDTPGALQLVLQWEETVLVQSAMASLPPLDREILSLRFEEEMMLAEIAQVLSVPLSTAKSRLSRALERMRSCCLSRHLGERPQ